MTTRADLERRCASLSPADTAAVIRLLDAIISGKVTGEQLDACESDPAGYVTAVDRLLDEVGA